MPVVLPFRGLRYRPEVVGPLPDVLVPPYGDLTDELATELRTRSPWNLIHVEAPVPDGASTAESHRRAAERLRAWIRRGALGWDAEPGYYIYRHHFTHEGVPHTRIGLIGLAQMHEWRERVICPHEGTHPAVVENRRSLLAACRTNLSLGIALVKDPHMRFLTLLSAAPYQEPPVVSRTPDGTEHEFGRVTDPVWCRVIQERLRYARMYVADGHHRYEAALRYRRESRSGGVDFMLMHVVSTHDPGLLVLPMHRLIHQAAPLDPADFADVRVRPLSYGLDSLAERWSGSNQVWIIRNDRAQSLALESGGATVEVLIELADRLAQSAASNSSEVAVSTTPYAQVAVREIAAGRASAALLVPAAEPSVVTRVADQGQTLPPRSTYFWPKPMAGLVMRTLDAPETLTAAEES